MTNQDMLTGLIAQAAREGGDIAALRAIVEAASDLGAERVLARLGLGDERAESDIGELRELLQAWRDAKARAWRAAVDWIVRGMLALLLIGIAVRLGFEDLLK